MIRLHSNPVSIVHIILMAVLLVAIPAEKLQGQSDDAIQQIFTSSDKSKLDKASEYKNQGDALIEEANQLYMETFAVQADVQLDEKKIKKEVEKLESNAQKKQFEALELYNKCNQQKYEIYKKYIEEFWSGYSGNEAEYVNARLIEEQSNDYFYQSVVTRNEAGKARDSKDKIQKLNDANDLQIRALEKQITALGYYYSIETAPPQLTTTQPQEPEYRKAQTTEYPESVTPSVTEPVSATPGTVQPVSGNVQVNREVLEIYNRYLNDTLSKGDSFLTPELLARIGSFNADQILNIWYNYAYGSPYSPEYAEQLLAEQAPQVTDSMPEDLSAQQYQEYQDMSVQEKAEEARHAAQTELKLAEIHKGEEDKVKLLPADENLIFRVQLAANKSQLTQRALQSIYYGNKQIEMILEDDWFKYSIGDFPDYKSADKFRSQCGVENAFIVAYRKGTRFMTPSEADEIAAPAATEYAVSPDMEGLLFRVQIAASRIRLNKEQLASIYGGPYPVEMVEEEGWYKYQILGVRLFSDALRIIRDVKVKGSFIVAYDNNNKINLLEAVKQSRKLEKEVQTYGRRGRIRDVEFHVQVAASKVPLRVDELMQIYPGSYKTILIFEEGWYKYRIKAGSSYEEAKRIKQDCGVEKAFITAYDRAVKTPLNKVIDKYRQFN
ncbi:MAG: hypothetical protein JW723_03605 [Bacteroidales bacterium]|nr:hypothetical protein [Bacteroidales bacterium]